ncbi:Sec1 family protein [Trichuris suis]|nr:Sec1 family protein [Trichuris suis]
MSTGLQSSNTLRSQQIAVLRQMLNFNRPISNTVSFDPFWKILVYDKTGMDILSPLFTVKELRDYGVTLHLQLTSKRDPLPDVPCIYFIAPSQETIQALCNDFVGGLYESYFLNFISPLARPYLEDLATAAVKADALSQVFDQYMSFITLEDDLFILKRYTDDSPLSFYSINRPEMDTNTMDEIVAAMADGLFSKLNGKIRDNLRDARNSLFSGETARQSLFGFQRPLLIICDRSLDLATPFHHTWTYQALVHDVLAFELNRVIIPSAGGNCQEFDVAVSDKFWNTHKGSSLPAFSPFPNVAEAIQVELENYRTREEEIRKLKSAMVGMALTLVTLKHILQGLEDETDETVSMLTESTAELTSAMRSLPELLERKRLIDLHTNIATAVLEQIKVRQLDSFFEAEEKLMNKQSTDRPVLDIIKDQNVGSPEDKMRLTLVKYLCDDMTEVSIFHRNRSHLRIVFKGDLSNCLHALEAIGCNTSAFKYLKRVKQFSSKNLLSNRHHAGGGGGTKTIGMFSKLLNQSSQFIMEGVKNLVIQKRNLPLTGVVDALMEAKSNAEVDDYLCFDPKLLKDAPAVGQKSRATFNEAIVFMIGGGTYAEYQNLLDYRKSKRIIFGCTELVNGVQFLDQANEIRKKLTRLGSEI